MGTKRIAAKKMNFIQRTLDALKCPPGEDRIYAYDTGQRGLGIRVLSTGRKVFIFLGKVHGRTVRENLGVYPDELTVAAARKLANLKLSDTDKGLRVESIPIDDAFAKALDAAKRGAKARDDWEYSRKKFVAFLEKQYPAVKKWEQVTRAMVREYLRTKDGLSDTRRRLDLQPIIQASRFMAREYGFQNFADGLGIGSKLSKPPATVYLADVLDFLDYLKEEAPLLEAGAALQSLAGLQLQEALRLTWDKVDLKRGLVEVSGEVKNLYRNRAIPIHARVLDALKRAYAKRPALVEGVQDMVEYVVLSPEGKPFLDKSWQNYGKRMIVAMQEWKPAIDWKPKDLRNCLPTLAVARGVHSIAWELYIGHAPQTVTARHYVARLTSATKGEEEALEEQMGIFQKLIIGVIDDEIQAIKKKRKEKAAKAKVVQVAQKAN